MAAAALLCGCRLAGKPESRGLPALPVQFVDVARESGVTFRHRHGGTGHKYFVETNGSGACFFDYDNDGAPDLYLVQSGDLPNSPAFGRAGNRSVLYHNDGRGRFTDVTDRAGVGNFRYGQGACAGDFDGDGFLDLYVTNYGANRLYRNNGNGTFTDVADRVGVASSGYHSSATFFDMDGDGDLDLYVTRYVQYRLGSDPACGVAGRRSYCSPQRFPGAPDVLFRNDGGRFTDVTRAAGVLDPDGKSFGVLAWDYDDDGRPDLSVANDGTLNRLYHNLGGGKFEDVTGAAGVGLGEKGNPAGSMGLDAADYDGDGRLDLFVTNFSQEPNDLFWNAGGGLFEMRSGATGLAAPSYLLSGFGAAFTDYDLDGWPDILVANGHPDDNAHLETPGVTYAERPSLYRNLGGRFQDVSGTAGPDFARSLVGRGLALADIDGDGDEDAVLSTSNQAAVLYRNEGGNARSWIRLRLQGQGPNRFAVGARVTLEAAGHTQVREVRAGSSFASQNDLTLTLGLGTARAADRVRVRWPGTSEVQEWRGLAAGQAHVLRQGATQ